MSDFEAQKAIVAKLEQNMMAAAGRRPPVDPPNRRPHDDGMPEDRLGRLEKRVDSIEGKLDALTKDVAEIKGRIASMPTAWQLLGMNMTMLVAVAGLTLAIVRFGLPH